MINYNENHDEKGQFASGNSQINSPEFKKWFGDSKVVDKSGKSLLMFHGTNKSFDSFRPSPGTERGEEYWLISDPDSASAYAGGGEGSNVIPAYVSIKNPAPFGSSILFAKEQGHDGL